MGSGRECAARTQLKIRRPRAEELLERRRTPFDGGSGGYDGDCRIRAVLQACGGGAGAPRGRGRTVDHFSGEPPARRRRDRGRTRALRDPGREQPSQGSLRRDRRGRGHRAPGRRHRGCLPVAVVRTVFVRLRSSAPRPRWMTSRLVDPWLRWPPAVFAATSKEVRGEEEWTRPGSPPEVDARPADAADIDRHSAVPRRDPERRPNPSPRLAVSPPSRPGEGCSFGNDRAKRMSSRPLAGRSFRSLQGRRPGR